MRKRHNRTLIATLAATLVLTATYSLTGCGGTPDKDTAASTEIATETETSEAVEDTETECETETTEAVVSEEKLSTETTEATEAAEAAEAAEIVESTEAVPAETESAYTFTDMEAATMYAKSTVNVRDLPSTDGSRLGSLSKNQEVAVTGQCNETGWYRIAWEGGTACVSNKYLSENKTVEPETADASANTQIFAEITTDEGTIPVVIELEPISDTAPEPTVAEPYYDRAIAEEIWGYVNAERASAGLSALAWDEEIYNFACGRAQAIVTNFSHDGSDIYGENILGPADANYYNAYDLHTMWYNSQGHHDNYMGSNYVKGACAVYYYNGSYYAVENFTSGKSKAKISNYRTVNGVEMDLPANEAAAFDAGSYWTASNGVVVFILPDGGISCCGGNQYTADDVSAAMAEYRACH